MSVRSRIAFQLPMGHPHAGLVTKVTWTISGPAILYSGQHIPNPSLGEKNFVNMPYDITTQTGSSVSFTWGEKEGAETITATPTLDINGKSVTSTPITARFYVQDPGWYTDKAHGIYYLVSASIQKRPEDPSQDWLTYGSTAANRKAGIDWSRLTPVRGGQFSIVQIIKSGTATVSNSSGSKSSFTYVDQNGNVQPAPFPLVDGPNNATTPFYGGTNDSPAVPLGGATSAVMNESFTDYVMYNPQTANSIWVPMGRFDWTVNSKATWNTIIVNSWWGVTNVARPTCSKPAVDHQTWPKWNDAAYKYTAFN